MKVLFVNDDVQALCSEARISVRKLGVPSAKKLHACMAGLFNARAVTDLFVGAPHPLKGNRLGDFAVSLHGGHRLVFQCSQRPIPVHENGSTDWSSVTEIIIIEVGDYHD